MTQIDWKQLSHEITDWCRELGFSAAGISDIDLQEHERHLQAWLQKDFHGDMHYMARHGDLRSHPERLHPGTCSIISVRLDYLEKHPDAEQVLSSRDSGYISRYALGRDYHKVIRGKLKKLVSRIDASIREIGHGAFSARVFTDSAPLLEKAVAEKAGLGWIGKNTLLLNEKAGSWYFLGEVLTNLPLIAVSAPPQNRCGSCRACIEICPTDAIVAPYELDARRCISYLTIENRGSIPTALRVPMGNRIFGCDDCQLVCPWNRYASNNQEPDFKPRHGLEDSTLVELFEWTEQEFLKNTEGSAIRRTGYSGWRRNLAVALGNAAPDERIRISLESAKGSSDLVDEHIDWALLRQRGTTSV
jgi:epoxyqueuosine reductase